jgi:streptogramin lyase
MGDFSFTVTVEDSASPVEIESRDFTISITDVPPEPLEIVTDYLYNGMVGRAYNQQIEITGGTPVLTWSIVSGDLPPGLTLNQDGTITGTPTARGKYQFTVQVIDGKAQSETAQLQIIIESDELWTHYQDEFNDDRVSVRTIFVDSRERKWIGTGYSGIFVFEGDGGPGMEWVYYDKNNAYGITEDKDGNMWIGHWAGGVNVLKKDSTWEHHLGDAYCHDILADSKGRIWVATYYGMRLYTPSTGSWSSPSGGRPYSIAEGNAGTIWVGGMAANGLEMGFGRIDGTTLKYTKLDPSGPGGYAVAVGADNMVWVGRGTGLMREYDPSTSSWTANSYSGERPCSSIALDNNGNVWSKWKSGKVQKNGTVIKSMPDETYEAKEQQEKTMVIDHLNNKWMGSIKHGEGLYRYTGD